MDSPHLPWGALAASAAACCYLAWRAAQPGLLFRPTFVLFGDSITQQSNSPGGWGARLADAYSRKVDVINRGYSGYNTRWALLALGKIFPRGIEPPRLVTVFFGANDAMLEGYPGQRQHVPLAEYSANLRRVVAHVRAVAAGVTIVMIAPPPIDEPGRLAYLQKNPAFNQPPPTRNERTNAEAGAYARACMEVAREEGVAALDTWSLIQKEPEWGGCLSDGLHLSPRGNEVVYKALQAAIVQADPALDPERMAGDLPWHFEIDPASPADAFRGR
mmetsp:Transcript_9966/g.32305  ORF Transcript_9966/g.32305 Transcript_9966/m.32305 type:complete len:274 (-) Transcript_9966:83-904(-)